MFPFSPPLSRLHILRSQNNQLFHIGYHHIIIQYPCLDAFPEPHDMAQIDGYIPLPCQPNNKLGAIISAGGGIEHQIRAVFNEQKGLCSTGEHHRRDHAQNRTLDQMLIYHFRFVHTLDDRFGKIIADPRILIGIFEINLCIVDSFRHIAKVDVEHGISTLPLVN